MTWAFQVLVFLFFGFILFKIMKYIKILDKKYGMDKS